MNAQQKATLLNAIALHVQAQIELSWSGSQPVQDHAAYQEDARVAKAELIALIDTFADAPTDTLRELQLRREIHLLNRAMQRKNRKLKAQYAVLKDGGRKMSGLKVVYRDGFYADEVPLHITRIEGRSDETRLIVTGGDWSGKKRPLSVQVIAEACAKASVAVSASGACKTGNNTFNTGKTAELALDEALAGAK